MATVAQYPTDPDLWSSPVSVPLGEDVVALLRRPSTCYIATTMPDGSPQLTQTWVDTDGEHVLINSVESHQKTRNIARDPRVAVAVSDPSDPSSYVQIRGRVLRVTTEGQSTTSRHSRRSISAAPTRGSAAGTRSG